MSLYPITDQSDTYASNHNYYIYIRAQHHDKNYFFKAFLTNFEDKVEPSWSFTDAIGREPVGNYLNTKRTLNFSFDVVAGSLEEARHNYRQSKSLLRTFYPTYMAGPAGQASAGAIGARPIHFVRFANLITHGETEASSASTVPQAHNLIQDENAFAGIIFGASYKPDLEAGVFEGFGQIFPKVNKFDLSFQVYNGDEGQADFFQQEDVDRIARVNAEVADALANDGEGAAASREGFHEVDGDIGIPAAQGVLDPTEVLGFNGNR